MPPKKKAPEFEWASVLGPTEEEDFSLSFDEDPQMVSLQKKPKAYRKLDTTGNWYNARNGVARPTVCNNDEWPVCDCEPGGGCGDDCVNRTLFQECRLGVCQGGLGSGDCGNTACQTRGFPETEVRGWPGLAVCHCASRLNILGRVSLIGGVAPNKKKIKKFN